MCAATVATTISALWETSNEICSIPCRRARSAAVSVRAMFALPFTVRIIMMDFHDGTFSRTSRIFKTASLAAKQAAKCRAAVVGFLSQLSISLGVKSLRA